ncbi:MAG: hypothetical protein IPH62_19110 [Ignavibacteriae bacterium]|nr:hypothetical protein [Ignavibacteriota bacterium]
MKTFKYLFLFFVVGNILNISYGQTQDSLDFFCEKELIKIAKNVSEAVFIRENLEWAKINISRYAEEEIEKDLHKELVINKLQYIGYSNSKIEVNIHINQELNPLKNKFVLFHCFEGNIVIPPDSTNEFKEQRLLSSNSPNFYLAVDYIGRFYILDDENNFNELIKNYIGIPIKDSQIEILTQFYLNTVHRFNYYSKEILNIDMNSTEAGYKVKVNYFYKTYNVKEILRLKITKNGQIEYFE